MTFPNVPFVGTTAAGPCWPSPTGIRSGIVTTRVPCMCPADSPANVIGQRRCGAARSRVYCPGLITALVLYPPLLWYLSSTAYHEGLLTRALGFRALAIAGVIHGIDVAVSVFGVGRNSFRRTRA